MILAILALNEPDRTFALDMEEGDERDLFTCDEAIDVAKAHLREEVAVLENRLGELKRQLACS